MWQLDLGFLSFSLHILEVTFCKRGGSCYESKTLRTGTLGGVCKINLAQISLALPRSFSPLLAFLEFWLHQIVGSSPSLQWIDFCLC